MGGFYRLLVNGEDIAPFVGRWKVTRWGGDRVDVELGDVKIAKVIDEEAAKEEERIIDVVIDAIRNNKKGIREVMK